MPLSSAEYLHRPDISKQAKTISITKAIAEGRR